MDTVIIYSPSSHFKPELYILYNINFFLLFFFVQNINKKSIGFKCFVLDSIDFFAV